MSKRPESLETINLAMELMRRTPRGRKISVAELYDQITKAGPKRTLRTIQRQLDIRRSGLCGGLACSGVRG